MRLGPFQISSEIESYPNNMNENWQSRLNRVFMGRFEFLSSLKQDPRLINVGRYTIPGELVEAEHRHRSMLRRPGAYNETQAIIAGVPNFSGDQAVLWYRSLDYGEVLAMREMFGTALIISVSALPIAPVYEKYMYSDGPRTATYGRCGFILFPAPIKQGRQV